MVAMGIDSVLNWDNVIVHSDHVLIMNYNTDQMEIDHRVD